MQAVRFGLRFRDIPLDPDSVVFDAYITLTDSPVSDPYMYPKSSDMSMRIAAELSANSLPFGTNNSNIFTEQQMKEIKTAYSNIGNFELSRRAYTSAEVLRSDLPKSIPDATWDTPDLSPLVQEVLRLPGWQARNNMTFSFTPANMDGTCTLPPKGL